MNLIEDLEKSSSMDSPESIRIFSNTLQKMAESKDKKYLPIILNYLDDESEYTDMMKEIMGMAESFEAIDYVSTIIGFNEILQKKALDWLDIIHYRITNSEKHIDIYKNILTNSPNKEEVKEYLYRFLDNNPEKQKAISFILSC
ncbi:Imm30 family immunity protein [Photorhabdus heterorhabditis]|uniref:Imm30 family immunity protein n=1 Tax=Photorhabdus heterorhabditis TaxID=880156 RepID=UPI001BD5912A|nr:Imm30 family immunity protein [Photorhabdus heterorhabditis]MBS9442407.1 hypothetical protein [Photorhabdus heterorhabditis]